jgi:hypothetical protein
VIDLGSSDPEPRCGHCREPLNLHQPDESLPSHLLATCSACFRWFSLLALDEDSSECLMVELPDKPEIENACGI